MGSADAARRLLSRIEDFAVRADNPVLSILPTSATLERGRKYPGDMLDFGDGHWRAYYHCHPERLPRRPEHGHFHIFRACVDSAGQAAWTHLLALSMDEYGQPRSWFSVNRWVSGGEWLAAEQLCVLLERGAGEIAGETTDHPTGRWLLAMLEFYTPRLRALLRERDELLTRLAPEYGGLPAIFEERRVYFLSSLDIQLDTDLSLALGMGAASV